MDAIRRKDILKWLMVELGSLLDEEKFVNKKEFVLETMDKFNVSKRTSSEYFDLAFHRVSK